MTKQDEALGSSAIEGVAWQGLSSIGIRLMRAAVFLLLARMILPEEYGIVALASVFIAVLRLLTVGGLANAIIQQPSLHRVHLDTAFWSSAVIGGLLAGALALTAGPIASAMNEPALRPVLLALTAAPLIAGLSIVCEGLLSRHMQFRALSIRHLLAALVSTVAALALAVLGAGVWALVAQTLTEMLVSLVALWVATSRLYRPSFNLSLAALRDLYSYGLKVTLFDLTEIVSTRSDDFLIGSFLGSRALGVYSVAYRLLTIALESLQGVSSSVAFPLFSRMREQKPRLRIAFARVSRFNVAVSGPIFVFMSIASAEVVAVTLGPQWEAAAPIMRALSLAGLATVILAVNNNLLSATGFPGWVLALSIAGAVLNVVGFVIAVPFGVSYIAGAFAARAWLLLPVSLALVGRTLGGTAPLLRDLVPVVANLWVPALGGVTTVLLSARMGDLLALLLVATIMVPVYVVSTMLTARSVYDDLVALLSRVAGRSTISSRRR